MPNSADDDYSFKEMPLAYKLVLKLPKPSLSCFPERLQGIFWAIFAPIFIVCYVYLNLMIVLFSPFPVNLFLVGSLTVLVFLFVFRIHLDRVLNSQKVMLKRTSHRDIKERVADYVSYFNKRKSESRIRSDSDPENP